MRDWSVPVPEARYREERLYRRDRMALPGVLGPAPGDRLVLVADLRPALVFGWGRAVNTPAGRLDVVYTRRLFDDPVPGDDLRIPGDGLRVGPLGAQHLAKLKSAAGVPASVTSWLVSIDLPIEAETRGEAVRQFWSYVRELGPRELPTFVAPLRDELAMQAYVLGEQANLDPEEDS